MHSTNHTKPQLSANWRLQPMDANFYQMQKSVRLNNAACPFALNSIDHSNNSQNLLWNQLYKLRIEFILSGAPKNSDKSICTLFPGVDESLNILLEQHSLSVRHTSPQNLSGDRFIIFRNLNLLKQSLIEPVPSDDEQPLNLQKIRSREIAASTPTDLSLNIFKQEITSLIHLSLKKSDHALIENHRYLPNDLSLALSTLRQASTKRDDELLFAVAMELEEFLSYSRLRRSLNIVHTSQHDNKWTDIAALSPQSLQSTEKCLPYRLIDELNNIANGRTAPLLINEFGCVADGNHRLAAAFAWNVLHACDEIQSHTPPETIINTLQTHFPVPLSPGNRLTALNAFEGLSAILANSEQRKSLMALMYKIKSEKILTLPVIPILSYNGLAIEKIDHQSRTEYRRFPPEYYAYMQEHQNSYLKSRACFHLADRMALPWFSILQKAQ
jgi:hypothetical protein